MGDAVSWVIEADVKDGQLDAFRDLMNDMVASTKAESGSLTYEWFLSEDGKRMHIYERYADTAATIAHMGTFGEKFAERFMSLCDVTSFNVYGDCDATIREGLAPLGAVHHTTFGGFVK